jgi:hypothetical protein
MSTNKPNPHEYPYYFRQYIELVPSGDILDILEDQLRVALKFFYGFSEEVASYRYDKDKWNIKECLGHLIDTERIFSYRALCFARKDGAKLPGFDQDIYVQEGYFNQRTLIDLLDEYQAVREATIMLLKNIDEEALNFFGEASDFKLSVKSIPFIIAGHELHHIKIIKERYYNIGNE